MKKCDVFRRGDMLYVVPIFTTRDGFGISGEPVAKLPAAAQADEVGQAVISALANSRENVTMPADRRSILRPLLEAAGVKAWSTFARGARNVFIRAEGKTLVCIPTAANPRDGSFGHQPDQAVKVRAEAAEVGRAVLDLLARELV